MNTKVKNVLKAWRSSLKKYKKLDSWSLTNHLSVLGNYLTTKEDDKQIRNIVAQIRDSAISNFFDAELTLKRIDIVFELLKSQEDIILLPLKKKCNGRIKFEGQESRFKGETQKLFEEKLRFKDGMYLRNFDVEMESVCDSRKVRRIVEKRMCQAYHRRNRKNKSCDISNGDRYWKRRATAFQLYNIGQIEQVKYVSRGISTHWKRVFDSITGEVVLKKKMAYSSYEEAMDALNKWKVEHPEDLKEMHAYKCSFCGKWHIGHYTAQEDYVKDISDYILLNRDMFANCV